MSTLDIIIEEVAWSNTCIVANARGVREVPCTDGEPLEDVLPDEIRAWHGLGAESLAYRPAQDEPVTFVEDEKSPYHDYWFCHCDRCGHKTNTVLADGYGFCPGCGGRIAR